MSKQGGGKWGEFTLRAMLWKLSQQSFMIFFPPLLSISSFHLFLHPLGLWLPQLRQPLCIAGSSATWHQCLQDPFIQITPFTQRERCLDFRSGKFRYWSQHIFWRFNVKHFCEIIALDTNLRSACSPSELAGPSKLKFYLMRNFIDREPFYRVLG